LLCFRGLIFISPVYIYSCSFISCPSEGNAVGHWIKVVQSLQFVPGYNNLTLLTQTVGLQVKFLVYF